LFLAFGSGGLPLPEAGRYFICSFFNAFLLANEAGYAVFANIEFDFEGRGEVCLAWSILRLLFLEPSSLLFIFHVETNF
jgi:hypothetical protein